MKTNQTRTWSFLFGLMLALLFACNTFADGTNDYNVCIRNVHQVSPNVIELDIWMEWTGTNQQKFQLFQGGLNFNYDGLANGGRITGSFVPGSADKSLPPVQQTPNWNVNPVSKQIRFLAAIATPASIAAVTPPSPGFRLGTLRLTNSVAFTKDAPMNFEWSFAAGTNNTTQSKESFYLNGLSTGTGFLDVKDRSNAMKVKEGGGCRLSANKASEKLTSLSAYPNPTSGKFKVTFNTQTKEKFNLKVTDALGNIVMTDMINSVEGENMKDIDLGNVGKGMYFLSVQMEGTSVETIVPIVVE